MSCCKSVAWLKNSVVTPPNTDNCSRLPHRGSIWSHRCLINTPPRIHQWDDEQTIWRDLCVSIISATVFSIPSTVQSHCIASIPRNVSVHSVFLPLNFLVFLFYHLADLSYPSLSNSFWSSFLKLFSLPLTDWVSTLLWSDNTFIKIPYIPLKNFACIFSFVRLECKFFYGMDCGFLVFLLLKTLNSWHEQVINCQYKWMWNEWAVFIATFCWAYLDTKSCV